MSISVPHEEANGYDRWEAPCETRTGPTGRFVKRSFPKCSSVKYLRSIRKSGASPDWTRPERLARVDGRHRRVGRGGRARAGARAPWRDEPTSGGSSGRVEASQIGSPIRLELRAEVFAFSWLTPDRLRPVGKSGEAHVLTQVAYESGDSPDLPT